MARTETIAVACGAPRNRGRERGRGEPNRWRGRIRFRPRPADGAPAVGAVARVPKAAKGRRAARLRVECSSPVGANREAGRLPDAGPATGNHQIFFAAFCSDFAVELSASLAIDFAP